MERSVAPLNVSPLIKFPDSSPLILNLFGNSFLPSPNLAARWSLLIAGVLYGSARYNRLYKQEEARLAELERTREEREAKAKIEREKKLEREYEELSAQLGVKI